jgi:hypothetical protein
VAGPREVIALPDHSAGFSRIPAAPLIEPRRRRDAGRPPSRHRPPPTASSRRLGRSQRRRRHQRGLDRPPRRRRPLVPLPPSRPARPNPRPVRRADRRSRRARAGRQPSLLQADLLAAHARTRRLAENRASCTSATTTRAASTYAARRPRTSSRSPRRPASRWSSNGSQSLKNRFGSTTCRPRHPRPPTTARSPAPRPLRPKPCHPTCSPRWYAKRSNGHRDPEVHRRALAREQRHRRQLRRRLEH